MLGGRGRNKSFVLVGKVYIYTIYNKLNQGTLIMPIKTPYFIESRKSSLEVD